MSFRSRLAYSGQEDGWTAEAFHSNVNTFGAAVRRGMRWANEATSLVSCLERDNALWNCRY